MAQRSPRVSDLARRDRAVEDIGSAPSRCWRRQGASGKKLVAGSGQLFGIVVGSPAKARSDYGLALGAVAWATSYAVLAKTKLYKPMWEYDPRPLAKDLSAQTVFGTGTARAVRGLAKLRAASGRAG